MAHWITRGCVLALAVGVLSCFGTVTPQRSYFVMHGLTANRSAQGPIDGLVRVRTLDADTIYEKFQIVVRRNPYELQYSDTNVWAVKPNRMVSDMIARSLAEGEAFKTVARELGELRPDYILGGDLHAIEIYDSGDIWFAHLSLTITMSRYSNGEALFTYTFDERRPIPEQTFAQGARALSELLSTAMDEVLTRLDSLPLSRTTVTDDGSVKPVRRVLTGPAPAGDVAPAPDQPIYVPEKAANKDDDEAK